MWCSTPWDCHLIWDSVSVNTSWNKIASLIYACASLICSRKSNKIMTLCQWLQTRTHRLAVNIVIIYNFQRPQRTKIKSNNLSPYNTYAVWLYKMQNILVHFFIFWSISFKERPSILIFYPPSFSWQYLNKRGSSTDMLEYSVELLLNDYPTTIKTAEPSSK